MGTLIRLRQKIDKDLIEKGGGASLNSSNIGVRFYETIDDEGVRLRFSSELRALLFVSEDSLFIRFGDCMIEIKMDDLRSVLGK